MKNFVSRTKRFFISTLVFVFASTLVSPALASTNIGLSVTATPGAPNDNLIYGKSLGGANGALMLLQNGAGNDRFRVDPSGNIILAPVTGTGNITTPGLITAGQVKLTSGAGNGKVLTSDVNGLATWQAAAGGSQWTTSGSMIFYNGGNVGIGINAPTAGLHINTGGGVTPLKVYGGGNTGTNILEIASAGQATPNVMVVKDTGNVGIGSTGPLGKLDIYMGSGGGISWEGGLNLVNGTYRAHFIEDTNILRIGNAGTGGIQFNTASGGYALNIGDNGNVGIGSMSPNYKLDITSGDINLSNNDALRNAGVWTIGSDGTTVSVGSQSTGKNVGLYSNGSTPTVYANTSGFAGINTANPKTKLEVYGSTVAGPVNSGTTPNSIFQVHSSSNVTLDIGALNASPWSVWMQTDDVTGYQWHYALGINPLGGNVGIGNTSPSYALDVSGDIRANNGWLRTDGNTGWYSDTYGGGWYMSDSYWVRAYNGKAVYTSGELRTDGGFESGSISGAGAGTIQASSFIKTNSYLSVTGYNAGQIELNSSGTYYGNISNPSAQVWALGYSNGGTNIGTPVLSWNASGNVGIGTTNPGYPLQVNGTGYFTGSLAVDGSVVTTGLTVEGGANITGGSLTADEIYTRNWFRANSTGGMYWQNYDTRIYTDTSTYIKTRSDDGWVYYDRSANLRGYLYFDGSGYGLLGNTGNWSVRIPQGTADVYLGGDTYANNNLYVNGNTLYVNNSSGNSYIIGGNNGSLVMETPGGASKVAFTTSAATISAGTAAMTILGNTTSFTAQTLNPATSVGIGTVSPLASLDVRGAIITNGSASCGTQGSIAYGSGCSTSGTGYSFSSEGSGVFDTGIFSDADGHVNIINNGRPSITTYESGSVTYAYMPYGQLTIGQPGQIYGNLLMYGNASKNSGGGTWGGLSDQRLKKDISVLDGKYSLDLLTSLPVKQYQWINPSAHGNDTGVHAAVMAQDMEKVFPTWVTKTDPVGADKNLIPAGDQALNVYYPNDFDAYLIGALKELKQENQDKQTQLDAQQKEIDALQAAVANLQK